MAMSGPWFGSLPFSNLLTNSLPFRGAPGRGLGGSRCALAAHPKAKKRMVKTRAFKGKNDRWNRAAIGEAGKPQEGTVEFRDHSLQHRKMSFPRKREFTPQVGCIPEDWIPAF